MRVKHERRCVPLPGFAVVLDAVGGGDQPALADDGGATEVAVILAVQTDLPGELPGHCVLAAHDTGRFEQTPPTICRQTYSVSLWSFGWFTHDALAMVQLRY